VLNDVERGRFLDQPAREHLTPSERLIRTRALFDEHLHERPGLKRLLPRLGSLTTRQLDDDIADPARFAGLHHQILADIVALVEQADCRDPVLERRTELAFDHAGLDRLRRDLFGNLGRGGLRIALAFAPGEREQAQSCEGGGAQHLQASGVQA
jgi:hypothetical protein